MTTTTETGAAAEVRPPVATVGALGWIRVAKGSHCQATIRMMENSGSWANQSISANWVAERLLAPLPQ